MAYKFRLDPHDVPRVETSHRRIVTKFPVPESLPVMERIRRYETADIMDQLPVIWDRAKGHQIFDRWGNCWIDFTSTIFVANCGHGHPHLVKAITEQAEDLLHAYCYPTEIRGRYLEKLIAFVPPYLQKASLFSTGTEASERAVRLARLYGLRGEKPRRTIIGWNGNFHGKTMGALMAGGFQPMKDWIGYLDPNMKQLPFPYPWVLEASNMSGAALFERDLNALAEGGTDLNDIVAFLIESYQGWGAVFYPPDYVQAAREWSKKRDALLIFDEIQSGFGRSGKLFAYEHYGVDADIVTCGKGVSGSMPLSVVLGRADIIDLDPTLTSTHGGHPMSCAAGLANIEVFEQENLIAEAARKEALVLAEVDRWRRRFPGRIGRVLGHGMVWGIFITEKGKPDTLDAEFCDKVIERAMEKGLFSIRTGRGTIKLGPPLNIPDDALVEGLRVIEESIAEIDGH